MIVSRTTLKKHSSAVRRERCAKTARHHQQDNKSWFVYCALHRSIGKYAWYKDYSSPMTKPLGRVWRFVVTFLVTDNRNAFDPKGKSAPVDPWSAFIYRLFDVSKYMVRPSTAFTTQNRFVLTHDSEYKRAENDWNDTIDINYYRDKPSPPEQHQYE